MTESDTTILDHIDNIEVPGSGFENPANEYWALVCLWDGMEYLYRQISKSDADAKEKINPGSDLKFAGFGNLPGLEEAPKTLITSAFHWYAISACQYVRTVAAIAYRNDPTNLKPRDYAEKVIPEVLAFRDKVAAHFAWTTRNSNDNDAERLMSILPPLSFHGERYCVGEFQTRVIRNGKESSSETIQPWSLCRVHERLRERYCPETCD